MDSLVAVANSFLASISMMPLNIAYIHSPELERLGNTGTHPAGRSERVHRLVESLGLLRKEVPNGQQDEGCAASVADVVAALPATKVDLQRYHTQSFVGEFGKRRRHFSY